MGTLNKRADFRIDRMVAANEAHEASVAIVADLRKTSQVRSISHWSPYDRVGVVNADS